MHVNICVLYILQSATTFIYYRCCLCQLLFFESKNFGIIVSAALSYSVTFTSIALYNHLKIYVIVNKRLEIFSFYKCSSFNSVLETLVILPDVLN
jgi:hypothetical protein